MDLPKTKEELYGKYYLKSELVTFCKQNGLSTTGSKINLLENIYNFIQNKPIVKTKSKQKTAHHNFEPSFDKIIDYNCSNNETHRTFFKENVDQNFKFNVQFMLLMEENKGKKTYKDAIEMYKKTV